MGPRKNVASRNIYFGKGYKLTFYLTIVLILGFSCGKHEDNAKIKIGLSLPLSGALSSFGQAELAGFRYAFETLAAGSKIELIIEDNKGDPKEAVNIAQKLIKMDKVNYYYTTFTHLVAPIKDLAVKEKVPLFFASTNAELNRGSDYLFRYYIPYQALASEVAAYLRGMNIKSLFFVGEKAEVCSLIWQAIKNSLGNNVFVLHEETYLHTESNLKSSLLKVRSLNPDVIFACSYRSQRVLLKSLYELGLNNIPLVQTSAYLSNDVLTEEVKNLYKKFNTISAWYGISPNEVRNKDPQLFQKIRDQLKENPHITEAIISYITAKIMLDGITDCGADPKCFVSRVKNGTFSTAFGTVKFDNEGSADIQATMVRPEEFYRELEISF